MSDRPSAKKPSKSRAKPADPRLIRLDALGALANFDAMLLRPVFGTAFCIASSPFFEPVGSGALRFAWADASKSSVPELWLVSGAERGPRGTPESLASTDKDNSTFLIQLGVLGRIQGLLAPSNHADIDKIDSQRTSLVRELGMGILAQSHELQAEGKQMLKAAQAATEAFEIGRGIGHAPSTEEAHRL